MIADLVELTYVVLRVDLLIMTVTSDMIITSDHGRHLTVGLS